MKVNDDVYLKRALLETQKRVRDFANYAENIDDNEVQYFFKTYALMEGNQVQRIQSFLKAYE